MVTKTPWNSNVYDAKRLGWLHVMARLKRGSSHKVLRRQVRTKSSILMIIVNVARVLLCLHGSGRVSTYTLEGGKIVLGDHPKEGTLQTGPWELAPSLLSSQLPHQRQSSKPGIQTSRMWASEVTLHKTSTSGPTESHCKEGTFLICLASAHLEKYYAELYLSLRPHAWATAKGRFLDLSDQLFHKT